MLQLDKMKKSIFAGSLESAYDHGCIIDPLAVLVTWDDQFNPTVFDP